MKLVAPRVIPRVGLVPQAVRQCIEDMQLTARRKAAKEKHDANEQRKRQD